MFTGIIENLGRITRREEKPESVTFFIDCPYTDLALGESVSVNGTCLTVTHLFGTGFSCDVSPETLKVTAAGTYQVGTVVNLERALRVGDRLGGHFVMGHVDETCRLEKKVVTSDFWELTFAGVSSQGQSYLVPKGSVAVQGVSLTVNAVGLEKFQVMVIPHTLEKTNLSGLEAGMPVNVEWDWMTKVIVRETRERFTQSAEVRNGKSI